MGIPDTLPAGQYAIYVLIDPTKEGEENKHALIAPVRRYCSQRYSFPKGVAIKATPLGKGVAIT